MTNTSKGSRFFRRPNNWQDRDQPFPNRIFLDTSITDASVRFIGCLDAFPHDYSLDELFEILGWPEHKINSVISELVSLGYLFQEVSHETK